MNNQKETTGGKTIPAVPYLRLPDSGEPYLIGSKCRNCGEVYLGKKAVCLKCYQRDEMDEIALSRAGKIHTFTIVHQSAPWVKVPYIAAVVRLPEGPVVPATLVDCEPSAATLRVGMPVEMVTEKVKKDKSGNEIVAYKFRPVQSKPREEKQ